MKKLLNTVADVVPQMLAGLAATAPGLRVLPGTGVVVRADVADLVAAGATTLVSGGGAGHEPAHAGYVGPGMLTAAVAGEVFTSPSVDEVLAAVRAVGGPGGVLLVVKNYTGDRLNFGLAAEIARDEGVEVEVVVVADDVALAAAGPHAGRRGIAGTVLVHKLAGAAAAQGLPLAEVARVARDAAAAVRTMGVALTPCTVPAAGEPGFVLGPDEVEWGLGIHGEQGVERGTLVPADDVAARLVDAVLDDLAATGHAGAGDRVAVLVNNLGGTPPMELAVVARGVLARVRARGLQVERAWTGTFLTALEMAGVSVSVLPVDDAVLAGLDHPTGTPAWPAEHLGRVPDDTAAPAAAEEQAPPGTPLAPDAPLARALRAVADRLLAAEPELTALDAAVGDGDLGASLARAARVLEQVLADGPDDAAGVLRAASAGVRRRVGGTSGPLYAVLLLRAAAELEAGASGPAAWATAFEAGVQGVVRLGGAAEGDRTMLDALLPAARAATAAAASGGTGAAVADAAARAADDGAAATAAMSPRVGRSSYLGDRVVGHVDPGAHAAAQWLRAVADAVG